jgi:hypothetical protein
MKKLCKTITIVLLMCLAVRTSAQLKQFSISSGNRSEIATNVIALNDSSSVIAGYIYDISGSDVQQADMLVLRVSQNGTIMWQQQIGNTRNNENDIPFGLTQATNGDIIVVGVMGQNNLYQDNTAAIFRLDVTTGLPVWTTPGVGLIRQNPSPLQNGEIFYGVAELANGNIVAVGTGNYSNFGSYSLISVFDGATGANLYNETYDISGVADAFFDIVAVEDTVYILGEYSGHYKDLRMLRYRPGTAGGVIDWDNFYDMDGQFNNNVVSMSLNRPKRLYVRNNKLIFQGYGAESYGNTPYGQFIFECDLDGRNPEARYLENSGSRRFVGNTMIYPLDDHKMYIVQNPTTAYANATTWMPTSPSDAFAGEIDIFGPSDVLLQGKRFNMTGNQSLIDINFSAAEILHMVGVTSATPANNDIYYVLSAKVIDNLNMLCNVLDDEVFFGTPDIYPDYPSYNQDLFPTDPDIAPNFINPNLTMVKICGDDSLTMPCDANSVDVTAIPEPYDPQHLDCNFSCVATVTSATGWNIVGYTWQTPAVPLFSWPAITIANGSTSTSDAQTFTTPNGSGHVILKVYVTLVNASGDTCIRMDSVRLDCNGGHGYAYYKQNNTSEVTINSINAEEYNLYPNPTNSILTITSTLADIRTVKIIDITGKEVATYNYNGDSKIYLSMKELANGTYLIRVNDRTPKLVNKTE